jgi:hypothetical protein
MKLNCLIQPAKTNYPPMNKPPRRHVIITGTGRAGTTFLVQLLTNLKLDTGYDSESIQKGFDENARAGLENDVRKETAPYIVKSPWFCDHADEVVKRADINLEHVFIPMRDLYSAAESRRYVTESAVSKMPLLKRLKNRIKPPKLAGGLVHSRSKRKQEEILLVRFYKLILALSEAQIPVTLMHYPKFTRESAYLYEKLKPILGTISYAEFTSIFNQTVRPELVHDFNKSNS